MNLSDKIIAFAETLKVPDGALSGQSFVLRDWQKDIIRQVYDPIGPDGLRQARQALLTMGRKNGKGLALDTPLPTPTGWTTMGDTKVGDTLYDELGNECKITFVSEIHNIDCYEIEFSNGEVIKCDGDHRWETRARVNKPGGKSGRRPDSSAPKKYEKAVRDTRELFETQYYGRRKDRNHSIDMPAPLCGRQRDLPLDPYILGAWLGNGHKSAAVLTYGALDCDETLEILNDCGAPTNVRPDCRVDHTAVAIGLTNGRGGKKSESIQYKLRELEVLDNKHIPNIYLRAPYAQRLALLQGLMDTDGTCDQYGRGQVFTTILPELKDGFCELAASLGLKFSVKEYYPILNGKKLKKIAYDIQFNAFRDDTPVFRLKRKLERQRLRSDCNISPRCKTVQIVSIRQIETIPTKCIQVDSPSHLFLCGRTMIPTHNTATIAMLCLAHLCGPMAVRNGELYSVAFDREQAAQVFKYMKNCVEMDEELSERLNIIYSSKKIEDTVSGSVYQALSAESRSKHGKSSNFIIFDELSQFGRDRELYDVMMTSRGAHAEPLVWVISTQAEDDNALFSELVDFGKKINAGEIDDPSFVSFVFEVPPEADVWDEANWYLANPALGDFRSLKEMREVAEKAKRMPGQEAAFRNLFANQRVSADGRFITPDVWKANAAEPDLDLFQDQPCWGGLDLSAKNDLTALVFVTRTPEGKWPVLPYFWTPGGNIRERSDRDRVPYELWAKQDFLKTTPGRTIDYAFMARQVAELHGRLNIEGIRFDRWKIDDFQRSLLAEGVDAWIEGKDEPVAGGLRLIPHGQGFKDMNPAVETLEDLLLEGSLEHGRHPVLTMCAANVKVQSDPAGNRKFDKIKSTGRIDGIVALAMALNGAMSAVPAEPDYFNDFIKDPVVVTWG